jgi:hypothetical protein
MISATHIAPMARRNHEANLIVHGIFLVATPLTIEKKILIAIQSANPVV